ncbi:MAG: DUF1592 domain-containing protein, partial [Myxococcales bacterium]|nr:DUF1592 domain-containing protein [Myxococcales bacterium]
MPMRRSSSLLLAFALSACQGLIGDDPDPGTDPEASPEGACQVDGALSVPMQRINLAQFQEVATELFGPGLVFSGTYPAPLQGSPFSTYAAANPLADAEVGEVMEATEAVAMQVVDRLPACSGDERACASDYLTDLMGRAFRRPVKPDELSIALDLYDTARVDMDHAESLGVAVFGVLQMPQFLYVLEDLPAAGERKDLDGLEIAQRLALVLWDSLPDDELLAAAAEGKLASAEERRAQATRMLGDARAARTVSNFLREWLKVKDFRASVHEPELQDALEEELRRDLADALAAPDGLSELFTSSHTHVNSVLEGFYGLPTTSTGPDDWHEVDLPAEQRVGILTHPLLMARFAHGDAPSSILRGQFVRVNLLCGNIPPPPAGAADVQAELTPSGATPREQAQARLDHPTCGSCHQQMDPIGFGF